MVCGMGRKERFVVAVSENLWSFSAENRSIR
jgi:hypothetical protein